jgi:hypothetical protein
MPGPFNPVHHPLDVNAAGDHHPVPDHHRKGGDEIDAIARKMLPALKLVPMLD